MFKKALNIILITFLWMTIGYGLYQLVVSIFHQLKNDSFNNLIDFFKVNDSDLEPKNININHATEV